MQPRCDWAGSEPAMQAYHDTEWGRPQHDERRLFELLTLEGAQAGLSWRTILKKRENYRCAFDAFDPERVARYGEPERARLLADAGIVRNRLKIDATIGNAQACLRLREAGTPLDAWLWRWVDGRPVVNRWDAQAQVPAKSPLSDAISKALSKAGFRFVGSTIVYAYLQASGIVNDHLVGCFCHPDRARRRA